MTQSEVVTLARNLMDQHDLKDWSFKFDRAKQRSGCCKYSKKTITLSEFYVKLNQESDIRNTILHEIAHALAGSKNGHNHIWRAICIRIGAKPERCYDDNVIVMPEGRWKATCKGCTRAFNCHRKPKNINGRYCIKCGPVKGSLQYKCN